MPSPRPRIRTRPAARLAAAVALAALVSCGPGKPETLLESDVPAPPELDVRQSQEIRREAGTLVNGRFLMWGIFVETQPLADQTAARYRQYGWRETSRTISPHLSVLTFVKDTRTVRVELDARRIDPDSSIGIVELSAESSAVGGTSSPPVGG